MPLVMLSPVACTWWIGLVRLGSMRYDDAKRSAERALARAPNYELAQKLIVSTSVYFTETFSVNAKGTAKQVYKTKSTPGRTQR